MKMKSFRPINSLIFVLFLIILILPVQTKAAAPPYGLALELDGVDDYATKADNATLDLGTGAASDFTIETWFYVPDLTNNTTDTLIWKQGAYGLYILFKDTTPDRLIFRINTGPLVNDYVFVYYDIDLSVNWHHIAAIFDNEYTASQDWIALYLDGSRVTSGSGFELTPGLPNSTSALNIGAYVGVNPTDGWLEEVRLSDVIRYSGVSYTMPGAAFADDPNTRALWHFNEATSATSFVDSSGNGNTLTALNGARTGSPFPIVAPSNPNAAPIRNYFAATPQMFSWSPISWATGYWIEIADNAAFQNPILSDKTLTSAELSVSVDLLDGDYYWRIRAKKMDKTWDLWSVGERFTIDMP